jgi:phosphoesterase RecJ-like protein
VVVSEQDWARAVAALSQADHVALACHVDPDGDALGSMLAMARWLDGRGVKTVAGWGRARDTDSDSLSIPPAYTFLPGLSALAEPLEFPDRPEVMIAFDTGAPMRLGSLRENAERAGTLILIDHHGVGAPFGDIRLVDGGAAATAVLVDELITRMGGELDQATATCLYTALITDTGRFSYSSTDSSVLRFAARLLDCGIDHAAITRHIYETSSFGYLKVLGAALERAQLVPEVGLAWMAVTQSDLRRFGVAWEETEGFIDVLRRVEAADCTLVAKEQDDGRWKVSIRSQGAVDVGLVARDLHGGGHALAAAFVSEGSIDELIDRVVARLEPETPSIAARDSVAPHGAASKGGAG